MNISLFLSMTAEACPDRQALTCDGKTYTYGQLFNAAKAAAVTFRESGCEYVALLDTSSPAIPITLFGAALAGIPYVPLNYRLAREQLDELFARIDPAYLVVDGEIADQWSKSARSCVTRQQFLSDTLSASEMAFEASEDPSAIAVQLFTSGTTGAPKAAILRNEHLVSYILGSIEFMSADEDDATLVSVPPYHIAGISAIMSSIYACRRIVQLPNFSPEEWISLCTGEAVTNVFVVPTMLTRIVQYIDESGMDVSHLGRLDAIAYGGGKMPLPVIESALADFPEVAFTNAYGLTETSSTITVLSPEDHRTAMASNDPGVRARLGSVGRPLPAVEIEIRDEDGQPLKPNVPGEIFVRGPQVSGEYRERSAILADGWFPTRDAGHLDEEGYLFLSGRADDVIVRGGENISPAEIEDLLMANPAVVDCAAVAMPSEEWGEAVALAIQIRDGAELDEDQIRLTIREKLRSSRVPEVIRFVDELPYNETGKLLRRVVKEWFS